MKKIVVATDIHGSLSVGLEIIEAVKREGADALVLLGDLYYHGPRNPLPEGHGPMELSNELNKIADKIICVRGNCDADIDLMISEFPFRAPCCITVGKAKLFIKHGHESDTAPEDVVATLRGHFHVNSETEENGKRVLGIASASLPKDGCPRSYAVVADGELVYKTLDGGAVNGVVKLI